MYINTITGEYPISDKELRLLYPNTSFPSFTVPEHNEYKLVQDSEPPPYDPLTQKIVEMPPEEVDGVWTSKYEVVAQSPQELSDALSKEKVKAKARIAAKRYELEVNHPVEDSSRDNVLRLIGIFIRGGTSNVDFKTSSGWETLTPIQVANKLNTIQDYVQGCYSREKELCDAIDAATTLNDVLELDIDSGWPS